MANIIFTGVAIIPHIIGYCTTRLYTFVYFHPNDSLLFHFSKFVLHSPMSRLLLAEITSLILPPLFCHLPLPIQFQLLHPLIYSTAQNNSAGKSRNPGLWSWQHGSRMLALERALFNPTCWLQNPCCTTSLMASTLFPSILVPNIPSHFFIILWSTNLTMLIVTWWLQ